MFEKDTHALEAMGAEITTREIMQQPKLWQETFAIYKENQQRIDQFLKGIERKNGEKIRVIFTGAGTSQYVGDTLVPYLNKKGDHARYSFVSYGTTDIVASPLDYLNSEEVTVLISFARSGNSPESVATVDLANKIVKDLYHVTITCAPEGQLAKAAEGDSRNLLLLMPNASNDKGFAMTGSFTCMTLCALLVFDTNAIAEKENYVSLISSMGQEIIQRESDILALLPETYQRIVYLGSGSLSGLTREAQLKVLELTAGKVATVFDSSLGFRHGPKSFVDGNTLLFVFINNDSYTRQYDIDILNEVAGDQIAASVIGIGQKVAGENEFAGQHFMFTESKLLPEAYLALPDILFAQTIALQSSISVGNTPDTPSPTGTVNRVVQGVTIHPF